MAQEHVLHFNLGRAKDVIHSLSSPSKMPCPSWGISPSKCITGSRLRQVPGTTCSDCYACKGRYAMKNVAAAHEARYQALEDPEWVFAMIFLISTTVKNGYFRWFDSGDLQSAKHLQQIIEIAEALPHIQFWLPTQERQFLKGARIPPNLTVRVSAVKIGKPLKRCAHPTSSVKESSRMAWAERIRDNTEADWHCLAPIQGGECQDCRACWDPAIKHVIYRRH